MLPARRKHDPSCVLLSAPLGLYRLYHCSVQFIIVLGDELFEAVVDERPLIRVEEEGGRAFISFADSVETVSNKPSVLS